MATALINRPVRMPSRPTGALPGNNVTNFVEGLGREITTDQGGDREAIFTDDTDRELVAD